MGFIWMMIWCIWGKLTTPLTPFEKIIRRTTPFSFSFSFRCKSNTILILYRYVLCTLKIQGQKKKKKKDPSPSRSNPNSKPSQKVLIQAKTSSPQVRAIPIYSAGPMILDCLIADRLWVCLFSICKRQRSRNVSSGLPELRQEDIWSILFWGTYGSFPIAFSVLIVWKLKNLPRNEAHLLTPQRSYLSGLSAWYWLREWCR